MQLDALKQRVGCTETPTDHATLPAVERLAATLDRAWDAKADRT